MHNSAVSAGDLAWWDPQRDLGIYQRACLDPQVEQAHRHHLQTLQARFEAHGWHHLETRTEVRHQKAHRTVPTHEWRHGQLRMTAGSTRLHFNYNWQFNEQGTLTYIMGLLTKTLELPDDEGLKLHFTRMVPFSAFPCTVIEGETAQELRDRTMQALTAMHLFSFEDMFKATRAHQAFECLEP